MALSYVLFDPVVKHIVLKKLVLQNSSEVANLWEEPPITPHLKVSCLLSVGYVQCTDLMEAFKFGHVIVKTSASKSIIGFFKSEVMASRNQ